MKNQENICFDLEGAELLDFKRFSMEDHLDLSSFSLKIVSEYLERRRKPLSAEPDRDRRRFPRKVVSIPAVSLVNFTDNETRSYPVVVKNISQSGVQILFRQSDPVMNEEIIKATWFEVVFSVPKTSITLSLGCKPKRTVVNDKALIAGVFEKGSEPTLSMMSGFFENGLYGLG